MNKNEYNKWYLVLAIFAIVSMFFGGSLAYWTWTTNESERTSIALTISDKFRCDADGGGNITSDEKYLVPTDCTNTEYAIQRTVSVNTTVYTDKQNVSLDLWLTINTIGDGLKNSSNFKYALTTNSSSCTEDVVSSGTFKSKSVGSTVTLIDSNIYNRTTTETYYLYVWLDKEETSSDTMDQDFSISLGGECMAVEMDDSGYTDTILNGSDPVLDDGMIPIVLSDTGVATVADTSSEWYNYENKEWANAVLVNESATSDVEGSYSREYYLNNPGTIISETDILAYYVWIPRYKYQIWTTSTSSSGSEQTIQIVFESKDTAKSTGTAVGDYLTHPAFTFGDEELAGIWVGKFETTGDATTPTILPNKQSLRYQNVSTQFTTSLKFAGGTLTDGEVTYAGSNTYGLASTTDSHMMKNNEWGAVVYLSHSVYGINSEIYINNSTSYYTGRSGGNVGGSTDTSTYGTYSWIGQAVAYNGIIGTVTESSLGTNASTTGNVTGVYDMSGGAWEYVMGFLENGDDYSNFTTFPNSKYYDLYLRSQFRGDYSTNMQLCTLETCGGHALNETASWYGDYANFVDSDHPWFVRGGYYNGGSDSGAFYSTYYYGAADSYESWRSVLVARDGA